MVGQSSGQGGSRSGSGHPDPFELRLSPDDRPAGPTGKAKPKRRSASTTKAGPSAPVKSTTARRKRNRKTARRKPSGRTGARLWRGVRFTSYWGTIAAIWGGLVVGAVLAYHAFTLPQTDGIAVPERPPSIQVLAVDGTLIGRRGKMRGHAIALGDMPPYLREAVIATEDARFYGHFGVDPFGLARAMIANVRAGRVVQGGSTITQQLAKNLFLEPERTIERKLQEMVLAFWLEHRFSKDEILEIYLNRVYLGAGAHGVEAAAQTYFDKSAREVTLSEAAILAGLLKAPSRFAPTRNPELAEQRARVVLGRMRDEGYITAGETEIALTLPAQLRDSGDTGTGYVADWVADEVASFIGEVRGDVIVDTTIDLTLQRDAEAALAAVMAEMGDQKGASQAALVSIDGIGAVRALVGGVNYRRSQFNRAVTAKRQPGSAFKPFVYLAALEYGLTPDSIRVDGPTRIKGWAPQNYDGDHLGPITLTDGLSRSVNTIAARLTHEVGAPAVAQTARRMGVASVLHENPSIALGTAEVSLLELAGAYVPFSNGGYGAVPHVISRIRTLDGEVLYERNLGGLGAVVAPEHVAAMNWMMQHTIIEGTGRRAAFGNWPIAGKTGTSQDFRDAWFMGFTANLVTGVWVGNDDGTPTIKATGGSVPAEIWRRYMETAHAGIAPVPLPGTYQPGDPGEALVQVDNTLPWLDTAPAAGQPGGYTEPDGGGFLPIDRNFLRRIFSG